ncbi:hypothetical protein ACFLZ1_04310 [Patescibacteria group bacterium]
MSTERQPIQESHKAVLHDAPVILVYQNSEDMQAMLKDDPVITRSLEYPYGPRVSLHQGGILIPQFQLLETLADEGGKIAVANPENLEVLGARVNLTNLEANKPVYELSYGYFPTLKAAIASQAAVLGKKGVELVSTLEGQIQVAVADFKQILGDKIKPSKPKLLQPWLLEFDESDDQRDQVLKLSRKEIQALAERVFETAASHHLIPSDEHSLKSKDRLAQGLIQASEFQPRKKIARLDSQAKLSLAISYLKLIKQEVAPHLVFESNQALVALLIWEQELTKWSLELGMVSLDQLAKDVTVRNVYIARKTMDMLRQTLTIPSCGPYVGPARAVNKVINGYQEHTATRDGRLIINHFAGDRDLLEEIFRMSSIKEDADMGYPGWQSLAQDKIEFCQRLIAEALS